MKSKNISRCILVVLATSIVFLSGCESREEKELRKAREMVSAMEERANEAQRDYDKLLRDIESYKRAVDKLK